MGFFSARGSAPVAPSHGNRSSDGYAKHRANAAERQRRVSEVGRNIAPVPVCLNPDRRAACLADLYLFGKTYFPDRFYLPQATTHRDYIADLERIVRNGGQLAVAMPRGSGKSAWAEVAVIWAILRGDHQYVIVLAATNPMAQKQLRTLHTLLTGNEELAEDFPEVIYPLRCHAGVNQRRLHCDGRPLKIEINAERILIPAIPDSPCSEAIIECLGLLGAIRGRAYERSDGKKSRPTLVIADDPQTKRSAASLKQTDTRESVLNADTAGLAGPDQAIAIIATVTVMQAGDLADRLLDKDKNPSWNGRRAKLLDSFPANMELWQKYREKRDEGLRAGDNGATGNAFYIENREELDRGAICTWPERFPESKVSAIQAAMDKLFDNRLAFFSEMQNDPAGAIDDDFGLLQADDVVARQNGLPRSRIRKAIEYVAAGLDVHGDVFYWSVMAAEQVPTMDLANYGTFPGQVLDYFTKRGASRKLSDIAELKSLDPEARLTRALEMCVDELMGLRFQRDNGELLQVGKIVLDCGWMTKTVTDWARQSKHADRLLCAKGITKADEFNRRPPPGTRQGVDYYVPPLNKWAVRVASVDSNAWISRVHGGFQTPVGSVGAWTLFSGESPEIHRNYADHITAETPSDYLDKRTGQTFRVWKPLLNRDNHWLDATKMAALGCFELGCRLAHLAPKVKKVVQGTWHEMAEEY